MTLDEVLRLITQARPDEWLRNDHMGISTLVTNLNVTIREDRNEEHDAFTEEWATKHADCHANRVWYDLYYGASFVRRYLLVSVDGNRATVPVPKAHDVLRITREQYAVGVAADLLNTLDDYLLRCGITVE